MKKTKKLILKDKIKLKRKNKKLQDLLLIYLKSHRITLSLLCIDEMTEEEKLIFYREFYNWLFLQGMIDNNIVDEDVSLEKFLTTFFSDIKILTSTLNEFAKNSKNIQIQGNVEKIKKVIDRKITMLSVQNAPFEIGSSVLNYDFSKAKDIDYVFYEVNDKISAFFQLYIGKVGDNIHTSIKSTNIKNQFSSLSMNELINKFSPECFYSLSKSDIVELCTSVSAKYCESKGVPPCNLTLANYRINPGTFTYGSYSWANQGIKLNNEMFDVINRLKEEGNKFFPYSLLQTIIHESQHRVQHSNLEKEPLSQKENLVRNYVINNNDPSNKTFKEYISRLEEKDARDEALKFLQEKSKQNPNSYLKLFTDNELLREANIQKNDITGNDREVFKSLFVDKVDSKYTERSRINSERSAFFNAIEENREKDSNNLLRERSFIYKNNQ